MKTSMMWTLLNDATETLLENLSVVFHTAELLLEENPFFFFKVQDTELEFLVSSR